MDQFGIGAAIEAAVQIYLYAARRTGRSTNLIESLKDGDRICFANPREAERVSQICCQKKLKVTCIVVDPKNPHQLLDKGKSEGKTVFDHTWVEQFYLNAILYAQSDIDSMQKQSSKEVVSAEGFEPSTPRFQTENSTGLS